MWNMSIAAVLNPEGLGYSWKATPSPRAINACFWCQPNSTAASFHGYGIGILTCFWSSRVVTLWERKWLCAALVMDKEPFFVLWLKRNELCTISYKQFSQECRWQVRKTEIPQDVRKIHTKQGKNAPVPTATSFQAGWHRDAPSEPACPEYCVCSFAC